VQAIGFAASIDSLAGRAIGPMQGLSVLESLQGYLSIDGDG
jgi:hypothetical protein